MTAAPTTFIETQFPVSRLSKESYKERKANYSQTLTGLGKWWGRKPLVLVRAVILGLLLPASGDPRKDREVFLALLTMDDDGLRRRKSRNIPLKEMRTVALLMPDAANKRFDIASTNQDGTLVRHALYATWRATTTSDTTESLTWLRTELPTYHGPARESAASVLRYLANVETDHWREDAAAARLVAGAVENDHV